VSILLSASFKWQIILECIINVFVTKSEILYDLETNDC